MPAPKANKTRGLIQRNGVWYISVVLDGRHYRISTKKRSKKAAQIELAKAHADKAAYIAAYEKERERPQKLWKEWAEEYIELMKREGKRDIRRRESALAHITDQFEHHSMDTFSRETIEAYRDLRKDKVSPASVNRELAYGSHAFSVAINRRLTIQNPFKGVKRLKEAPGIIRYLKADEVKKLLDAAEDWFRPFLLVALETGCRKGELANLQWKDVDFHAGFFYVLHSKNGESRAVPMSKKVEKTFRAMTRHLDHPYVFTWEDGKPHVLGWDEKENQDADGRPIPGLDYKGWNLRKALERAKKKSGIKNLRFHDTRHHFGSWLAMSGVDMERRMMIMGHRTAAMAKRYTHLEPGYLKEAIRLMEKGPASKKAAKAKGS